ncbi:Rv3212 family protein [Nakamurella endophytica]|uniref:PQQ-binding-like beta-propeller repeat protein n=2 Tax=Nakamurella endophytica TaxID=1748367 RepID=A0A917WDZ5_9ACTN|nr:hypothetical protein GCM10011594_14260 [Nakamurella endophytica]
MTARRRRTTDRLLAAAIAVVVAAVGVVVYLTSDNRATTDATGPQVPPPSAASVAPTTLRQAWTAATDPSLGAVASPSGVVVTTDRHAVTAHDAVTGAVRWSYTRSNRDLCAVGSGDTDDQPVDQGSGVRGIATVYAENGFCSQLMTLDPVTGSRSKVRTSPLPLGGSLVFGGPYAGWLSPTLVEVWRNDLVRTIQYGVQPNPTNPSSSHLGCTFTDLALAETQFATVEHCAAQGATARVVLNFDDPGAQKPKDWDQFKHTARMDVDTRSPAAVIVGVTPDRVAVLVSAPSPAVVVYDAAGTAVSRTAVEVPAAEITAAAAQGRPLPAVQTPSGRISLVGSHLVAVTFESVQGPAPSTALTTPTSATASSGVLPTSGAPAADVTLRSVRVAWVGGSALGLPAVVGDDVLIPVRDGLQVADLAGGPSALGAAGGRVVAVNRGGWTGRTDAAAVGALVVETRGPTVVALR